MSRLVFQDCSLCSFMWFIPCIFVSAFPIALIFCCLSMSSSVMCVRSWFLASPRPIWMKRCLFKFPISFFLFPKFLFPVQLIDRGLSCWNLNRMWLMVHDQMRSDQIRSDLDLNLNLNQSASEAPSPIRWQFDLTYPSCHYCIKNWNKQNVLNSFLLPMTSSSYLLLSHTCKLVESPP